LNPENDSTNATGHFVYIDYSYRLAPSTKSVSEILTFTYITSCTLLKKRYLITEPGSAGNSRPFALPLSWERGPGNTCQNRKVSSPAPLGKGEKNIRREEHCGKSSST